MKVTIELKVVLQTTAKNIDIKALERDIGELVLKSYITEDQDESGSSAWVTRVDEGWD